MDTMFAKPLISGALAFALISGAGKALAEDAWVDISSPDGKFMIGFSLGKQGQPLYRVQWRGGQIIAPSRMGFHLDGERDWTQGFLDLTAGGESDVDREWKPVWGERSLVRDHYREMTFTLQRENGSTLTIEARAYNEGTAFRYRIDARGEFTIESEQTEFRFAEDHDLWAVYSAQGKYSKEKISGIRGSVERPCVLETAEGKVIAVAEAAMVDYARMRLMNSKDSKHTLVSNLHGPVTSPVMMATPWRVVMAADTPGQLLENNGLLLNLNEPSKIADASWIRPGKVIREITLSTEGGIACVDFAVANGLQFIEFDAGWYGPERDENSDARTVSKPGLDLPAVIRYANQRSIGVILYVNRRALERDLDALLPLYQKWGIAGLKFGFVQHGDQRWTRWMHKAIAKCANYQIMVDVHDEYRMTGWQRTYPNFMTAEGIGGDETRPTNEQALINLFTRMIASPADHTFCYYNGYVNDTTSHAAQLAKMVCFFSPWQFLFWYDRPSSAADEPELQFIKAMPTTWDETRVLHWKIGGHAAIARRSGDEWFIGCFNAGEARTLELKLDFLAEGGVFDAHIYTDDGDVKTRTKVGLNKRAVDSKVVLKAPMTARGGVAVRLVPAGK
jgi:alpha-glucosidase